MERTKIICLLLLISGISIGCDSFQASGRIEKPSENKASAEPVQSVEPIQQDSRTPDKVLFKGENMTVIEGGQGDLKQLRSDRGKKSCLNKLDENIKKKLSTLGYKGDTKYLEFDAEQTYNFGPDKFTVKFEKDLFSKLDPKYLKELDQYVGSTIVRDLYLIEDIDSRYLLAIGPESTGSGMGALYLSHLLIPLEVNRPVIEFESISDDPRRIKISDSGTLYYVQIDPPYFGAVKESTKKRLNLTVSLFAVDGSNKRLETKFDLECEDLDSVFHDL